MRFLRIDENNFLNVSAILSVQFSTRRVPEAHQLRARNLPDIPMDREEVVASLVMVNGEPKELIGQTATRLRGLIEEAAR
jgi:hypothetical protein